MPLDPDLQEFTTASQAVASYDYTDIINGLGYEIMQGYASINDTTVSYGLSPNTIYATPASTGTSEFQNTSFQEKLNIDFDTSVFNIPRTAKGTAFMNIAYGSTATGTGGGDCLTYCIVKLYHYNGTTETLIATAQQTGTHTETATGETSDSVSTLQFDISETLFAEGDLLRVNVEVWAYVIGGDVNNRGTCHFYHDPKDRTSGGTPATPTTKLEIHIPFKIDI